jgi:hypothetical protein
MFQRIKYTVTKIIVSIIANIASAFVLFRLHYDGPELKWAVDEFDNWLKWQGKVDKTLDPDDVRQVLWEFMNERGVE